MIPSSPNRHKKDRAKAQFFKEFTLLFRSLALDHPSFVDIYPTRMDTAPDGSVLYVYFSGHCAKERVQELIGDLILFKPSIRKALSQQIRARYVPQLVFKFDETFEKVMRVEQLLENLAAEHQAEEPVTKDS